MQSRGNGGRGNGKPICQLYGKVRHMVVKRHHRFNISFVGNSEFELSQVRTTQGDGQHLAYIISPKTVMASNWYMDSSATNHITTSLNNLTIKENYRGKEKLTIGNGQNLNIKQVGSTSFNLHTNSQPSNLKNILHVLSITKNLLNISHFSNDNKVILEFYVDCFYVKNKNSRKLLLKGTLRNGLY